MEDISCTDRLLLQSFHLLEFLTRLKQLGTLGGASCHICLDDVFLELVCA